MSGGDLIDLKFRLFDGTDIGPNKYNPTTTVGALKESILTRWPVGESLTLLFL
ncbi:Membrane-anchored ubiquitin-fold protein 3 [Platanthera guangdongensis]|uniref:Membrane-anchored ubiquitin-fold protein 3 n=1 Tax=Platanthera guangdongensis TaxID=2320717 RepID=A0ABR2LIV8_9ASPA